MRKIIMDNNQEKQDQKEKQPDLKKVKNSKDVIKEIGGPEGPEPTRYGDWERRGRCIDF